MGQPRWHYSQPISKSRLEWPCSPRYFKRVGIESAFSRDPVRGSTPEIRDGHRFQSAVSSYFAKQITEGWYVFDEVCFVYELSDGSKARAYVDAVAINPIYGKIVLIECKRSYVAEAYSQLWLYMALARRFWDRAKWEIGGIVVAKQAGFSCDCPGPADWLMPGDIRPVWWDGREIPRVAIVNWSLGLGWRLCGKDASGSVADNSREKDGS